MKREGSCCCGKDKEMEIPEQIQKDLDDIGGFDALEQKLPDDDELKETSRVYHALSDPIRLKIVYLIRDQPLCVCVINRFTQLSGSKLSYHLNILKESGIVTGEYHGNWIIYSLTEKGRKILP